jgi:hypothetical protein
MYNLADDAGPPIADYIGAWQEAILADESEFHFGRFYLIFVSNNRLNFYAGAFN